MLFDHPYRSQDRSGVLCVQSPHISAVLLCLLNGLLQLRRSAVGCVEPGRRLARSLGFLLESGSTVYDTTDPEIHTEGTQPLAFHPFQQTLNQRIVQTVRPLQHLLSLIEKSFISAFLCQCLAQIHIVAHLPELIAPKIIHGTACQGQCKSS